MLPQFGRRTSLEMGSSSLFVTTVSNASQDISVIIKLLRLSKCQETSLFERTFFILKNNLSLPGQHAVSFNAHVLCCFYRFAISAIVG